jgi:putative copper export protein
MYVSLAIFMVTGIYLMFADPNYLGVGDFGNLWSVIMLVKHLLIVGMIGLGFWYNALLRVGPMMASNNNAALGIRRFRMYSNLMAISGVLVLLLTALAQVE